MHYSHYLIRVLLYYYGICFSYIFLSCDSDFEYGRCSIICSKDEDHCNSMGYRARKPKAANRKYYLQTSGEGDYCGKTTPKSDFLMMYL